MNQTVRVLSDPTLPLEKERLYLDVRMREGRVLSDEAVRRLPYAQAHAREWTLRRHTFARLLRVLQQRLGSRPAVLLDLGCGNGWMAHRLSLAEPDWALWGADVNMPELEQGARLFGGARLQFCYADIVEGVLPEAQFDAVFLAASVQYFSDLEALTSAIRRCLKPGGAAFIVDSPFYGSEAEREAARQRSAAYYNNIGVPAMAALYHHHTLAAALNAGWSVLPETLTQRLLRIMGRRSPFPMLVLDQSR